MEKGRIIEQGNHEGLIKKNGYYAKLHSYQNHTPVLREVPVKPIKPINPIKPTADDNVAHRKVSSGQKNRVNRNLNNAEVDESWALELLDEHERAALKKEICGSD
jgi:subfamily B ATP-binding cassette protein HlyB/CyaB